MRQHFAMIQQWQSGVQRFKAMKKNEDEARIAEISKVLRMPSFEKRIFDINSLFRLSILVERGGHRAQQRVDRTVGKLCDGPQIDATRKYRSCADDFRSEIATDQYVQSDCKV